MAAFFVGTFLYTCRCIPVQLCTFPFLWLCACVKVRSYVAKDYPDEDMVGVWSQKSSRDDPVNSAAEGTSRLNAHRRFAYFACSVTASETIFFAVHTR